jgi:hypothetical protein
MSIERICPVTGTEVQRLWIQNHGTGEAVMGASEVHTTRDQYRTFLNHHLTSGGKHLGAVANSAARIGFDAANPAVGCWPGDTIKQTDTGMFFYCITNHGESDEDWIQVTSPSSTPGGAGLVVATPPTTTGVPYLRALVASDIPALSYAPVFTSDTQGKVWATPAASSGVPSMRALVAADIPVLSYAPTTGSASIVTLGTVTTGTWNATAIADGKIASALTGKTYNGMTTGKLSLIYAMGDSLTANCTWATRLIGSSGLDPTIWRVVNQGVSGNTTDQMAARYYFGGATVVILEGGINDIVGDAAVADIEANLQTMATAAHAAGAYVILCTITPFNGSAYYTTGREAVRVDFNTWATTGGPTNVDAVVDLDTAMRDPADHTRLNATYANADWLHYSAPGYNFKCDRILAGATWTPNTSVGTLSIAGGASAAVNQDLTIGSYGVRFGTLYLGQSLLTGDNSGPLPHLTGLGVGASAVTGCIHQVSSTYLAAGLNTVNSFIFAPVPDSGGTSSVTVWALTAQTYGAYDYANFFGEGITLSHGTAANVGTIYGRQTSIRITSSGSVGTIYGFQIFPQITGSGNLKNLYYMELSALYATSSGDVTGTIRGIDSGNLGRASANAVSVLYIADQTTAAGGVSPITAGIRSVMDADTNKYFIYHSGTAATYLHGAVTMDAGATVSTLSLTNPLTSANGGTGNGFAKISGPTTSERTFTLPNANATLLYQGITSIGINRATIGYGIAIQGTTATDLPTFSAEKLASGDSWTSTNWTGSWAGGWTHVTTYVDALVDTTLVATAATSYRVAYTVSGRTAGTFTVTFGGQTSGALSATGAYDLYASTTGGLTITPTSGFDGTIALSVKTITANSVAPLVMLYNSLASICLEMRAGSAGNTNTFVGYNAGATLTTGTINTAFGQSALSLDTTGSYNAAFGYQALNGNVTGQQNVAMGTYALGLNKIGSYNSAGGYAALYSLTGSYVTAWGYQAGRYIADGSTANATTSNSVYVGANTRASADGVSNELVLGYAAIGLGSNTTCIGNSSTTAAKIWGSCLVTGAFSCNGSPVQTKITVTGSRGANAALASLITAMASYGLVLDSSS